MTSEWNPDWSGRKIVPTVTTGGTSAMTSEMMERLCRAIDALLMCPEIADADPREKDEETHAAEREARNARDDAKVAIAAINTRTPAPAAGDLAALAEAWVSASRNDDGQSETEVRVERARAAFHRALRERGYVVVPVKPTEAMIDKACHATFGPLIMTPEEIHRTGYRAMIAVAQEG